MTSECLVLMCIAETVFWFIRKICKGFTKMELSSGAFSPFYANTSARVPKKHSISSKLFSDQTAKEFLYCSITVITVFTHSHISSTIRMPIVSPPLC